MASVIQVKSVYYPESDGKPMGETDEHRDEMVRVIELLRRYYEGQPVYVSGDLLVYYEQGNPKKFVVPDAFVVKGIDPKKRRIYKIWYEGQPPDAIIEVTSRKTRNKDTITKPALYARLGVKECFLFDPTQEYLEPPLQGYRLTAGEYQAISTDRHGALVSQSLGLRLQAEHGHLVMVRLDTGERLLTAEEARRAEAEARHVEAEARRAAEAEVARLREQLRRLQ